MEKRVVDGDYLNLAQLSKQQDQKQLDQQIKHAKNNQSIRSVSTSIFTKKSNILGEINQIDDLNFFLKGNLKRNNIRTAILFILPIQRGFITQNSQFKRPITSHPEKTLDSLVLSESNIMDGGQLSQISQEKGKVAQQLKNMKESAIESSRVKTNTFSHIQKNKSDVIPNTNHPKMIVTNTTKNEEEIHFFYLNSLDLSDEQSEMLTLDPPSLLLFKNGSDEGLETQLSGGNLNMNFNQILENIELTVNYCKEFGINEGLKRSCKRIAKSGQSSKKSNSRTRVQLSKPQEGRSKNQQIVQNLTKNAHNKFSSTLKFTEPNRLKSKTVFQTPPQNKELPQGHSQTENFKNTNANENKSVPFPAFEKSNSTYSKFQISDSSPREPNQKFAYLHNV